MQVIIELKVQEIISCRSGTLHLASAAPAVFHGQWGLGPLFQQDKTFFCNNYNTNNKKPVLFLMAVISLPTFSFLCYKLLHLPLHQLLIQQGNQQLMKQRWEYLLLDWADHNSGEMSRANCVKDAQKLPLTFTETPRFGATASQPHVTGTIGSDALVQRKRVAFLHPDRTKATTLKSEKFLWGTNQSIFLPREWSHATTHRIAGNLRAGTASYSYQLCVEQSFFPDCCCCLSVANLEVIRWVKVWCFVVLGCLRRWSVKYPIRPCILLDQAQLMKLQFLNAVFPVLPRARRVKVINWLQNKMH